MDAGWAVAARRNGRPYSSLKLGCKAVQREEEQLVGGVSFRGGSMLGISSGTRSGEGGERGGSSIGVTGDGSPTGISGWVGLSGAFIGDPSAAPGARAPRDRGAGEPVACQDERGRCGASASGTERRGGTQVCPCPVSLHSVCRTQLTVTRRGTVGARCGQRGGVPHRGASSYRLRGAKRRAASTGRWSDAVDETVMQPSTALARSRVGLGLLHRRDERREPARGVLDVVGEDSKEVVCARRRGRAEGEHASQESGRAGRGCYCAFLMTTRR